LTICIDHDGQLVYVLKIDQTGQWHNQRSLPADFLFDKIPEKEKESPQLPKEKITSPPDQFAGLLPGAHFL